MKGKFGIELTNNLLTYDFTITRNITIIQGDSGTGKTTLINMLESLVDDDGSVQCKITSSIPGIDIQLEVINERERYWEEVIKSAKNKILFFDEKCEFIKTKEFAAAVKGSDCYFVIITRAKLSMLPYSVEEIYRIEEDKRYPKLKKVHNTLVKRYDTNSMRMVPDLILTEDSNSGYEFVSTSFNKFKCISCEGKNNVSKVIAENKNADNILAIVDGAAFGPDMEDVSTVIRERSLLGKQTMLYAPESFEWIILRSELFYTQYNEQLDATYNYVDSAEHESWERYYTSLLIEITKNTPQAYKKSGLNRYYLVGKANASIKKMYNMIEESNAAQSFSRKIETFYGFDNLSK